MKGFSNIKPLVNIRDIGFYKAALNHTPSPQKRDRSPLPGSSRSGGADAYLSRARTSLRQALNRYSQRWVLERRPDSFEMQATAKREIDHLATALDKMNSRLFKVAVFGLVSRGKSAVLNALMGQKLLQTGPTHGVTQWARSILWSLETPDGPVSMELIDTPGLDEIDGQARADLAREVAYEADLILFVIAGDITRTEYLALMELQAAHKPLILVFNKTDLYPDRDRDTIYRKLQTLLQQEQKRPYSAPVPFSNRPFLVADDVVMVAADPAPVEVRVEYPDGRVEHEWEPLLPNVRELRDRLVEILMREGKALLALNALRHARDTEAAIAQKNDRNLSKRSRRADLALCEVEGRYCGAQPDRRVGCAGRSRCRSLPNSFPRQTLRAADDQPRSSPAPECDHLEFGQPDAGRTGQQSVAGGRQKWSGDRLCLR